MKQTLEKLWYEYVEEKCLTSLTEQEREKAKTTAKVREKLNSILNKEQQKSLETYVAALLDGEALFLKKAFFWGCEFAVSFIFEAGNLGK